MKLIEWINSADGMNIISRCAVTLSKKSYIDDFRRVYGLFDSMKKNNKNEYDNEPQDDDDTDLKIEEENELQIDPDNNELQDINTDLKSHIYCKLSEINDAAIEALNGMDDPTQAYKGISCILIQAYRDYSMVTDVEFSNLMNDIELKPLRRKELEKAKSTGNYSLIKDVLCSETIKYILKIVESDFLSANRTLKINLFNATYARYRENLAEYYKEKYKCELGYLIYFADKNKRRSYFCFAYDPRANENGIPIIDYEFSFDEFVDPLSQNIHSKDVRKKEYVIKIAELFWRSFIAENKNNNVLVPIRDLVRYVFKFWKENDAPAPEYFIPQHDNKEMNRALDECINQLPERHKRVIDGIYIDGEDQNDIARELGLSPARISQLKAEASEKLKTCMMRKGFATFEKND